MNLRRQPDFEQFLKVLRRSGRPDHLPFHEHFATADFIARRTGKPFDKTTTDDPDYWRAYVDFWIGMGFDCVPMDIPLRCPPAAGHGMVTEGSEAHTIIRSMADYEGYPWPDESDPIDYSHFEKVADVLPDGAKGWRRCRRSRGMGPMGRNGTDGTHRTAGWTRCVRGLRAVQSEGPLEAAPSLHLLPCFPR